MARRPRRWIAERQCGGHVERDRDCTYQGAHHLSRVHGGAANYGLAVSLDGLLVPTYCGCPAGQLLHRHGDPVGFSPTASACCVRPERADMSRTVVVGASSGLGRCIGVGLAQRGDQVALLARRRGRIEAAAAEAGPGTIAIECDITDEASCRSAINDAADALGGIDNLVYTPPSGRWSAWSIPMPKPGGASSTPMSSGRRWYGRGDAAPDGLRGQGGLPLIRRGNVRAALAGSGRLRRQQGGAREARGSLAGRTPRYRLHLPHRRRVRRRRG